jgi:hypothetical protein
MGDEAPSVFEVFVLFFFCRGACEDGVDELEEGLGVVWRVGWRGESYFC